jgi:type I restriction enzyme, R subunit
MSERSAVQKPMLDYAEAIGWRRVSQQEALRLRGGDTGLFFTEVLRAQLLELNPGVVEAAGADDIIRELRQLHPTIEGNRDALEWLRGEQSVYIPAQRRERNITLIDFEHPARNVLQVTDEWWQRSTVFRNRADVVFLVNGIPVAVCETKSATKPNAASEGVEQIRRYHRETPELFVASQVFEVTQLLDFYYGATWSPSRKDLFKWKTPEGARRESYEEKVKLFFDPPNFLRLLRDYIVFLTRDDVLSKIILRQHQMRAVEKAVDRTLDPAKRRGLVWHTQGSGKTLTMLTIADQLLARAEDMPEGEKPLVLMLVDRTELESQLFRNINAYGLTQQVATSKRELRDLLALDTRGLIVSMIHKFDGIPANINTGAHVIVLVDEAHRTTGGDLGNYLMGALPNATYIGFTGTPIDNISYGKGTFKVFGGDDPQGYLDKYSIAESVEDGTTVRLNYALAPSELRVDRETLEREFLKTMEAQGVADIEDLNAILDRAVALKEMMKNRERMDAIARMVAEHYRANVLPMGFKAFLVAVDREACALYKEALDHYLPSDWSTVVISPAHNDPALLKRHYLTPDQEKLVRADFARRDKLPRILIVTEKLLTGFDAPILYCMYLDKPMRDHVLLQAIARVNRPFEDADGTMRKPSGFVVDFVGIFERLEEALAFDSDTVASVIENVEVLKQLFARLMGEDAQAYLPYTRGRTDKDLERAIEHFAEKERRDTFFTFVGNLQNLYDVLSPDAFLRPYLDEYQAVVELYALIRNAYGDSRDVDRELTAKTRELLRAHTSATNLRLPGEIAELGPAELEALKDSDASDRVKVLNLRKVLAATVERDAAAQPFLLSIGDRAEALAQAYEDRQITTQHALVKFEQLALEFVEADAERTQLGLDPNEFAIYTVLKEYVGQGQTADQAQTLNAVFTRYPDYEWDAHQLQELRTALYQALSPLVGGDIKRAIAAANSLLKLSRV